MQTVSVLDEISKLASDTSENSALAILNAHETAGRNWKELALQQDEFNSMPSISIDCAVFEKSKNVAVVRCDMDWRDVGSFLELGKLYPPDDQGNNIHGNARCVDSKNCIIHSSDQLTAVLGVDDLIICNTQEALLISHKDSAEQIGNFVKTLSAPCLSNSAAIDGLVH